MSVSIIGTRGCGKSTFIGLLYQGMERYSNINPEDFIYYITSEVGDKIYDIRNNMLKGEYPAATTRHQLEQLNFLMGFKPKMHEKIIHLVKNFSSFGKYGDYLGMIMSVYDISGEDIQEYKRIKTLNENIKKIFDSNIVVVIIDCALLTNSTKGRKYNLMLEYDKEVAVILSAYVEYRARDKMKEKLHPIFILAKMDAMDSEIRNQYGVDRLEKTYDPEIAQEIGNQLMKSYLSATRAAMYGAQKVGIPLEDSKFFMSWVEETRIDGTTEATDAPTLRVVKPKFDSEQARNIYPEHMYEAFLNHIRELSYLYSDPKKQVEEIFGKVVQ